MAEGSGVAVGFGEPPGTGDAVGLGLGETVGEGVGVGVGEGDEYAFVLIDVRFPDGS